MWLTEQQLGFLPAIARHRTATSSVWRTTGFDTSSLALFLVYIDSCGEADGMGTVG
ncbi:hypothetical protein BJX64DRAFT_272345 [Aspergillus heterothallicus]